MIRAHRVAATAQDDASLIGGWNIAPNGAYSVALTPGPSSCGVFLFAEDGELVASGAALAGTEQPCILYPQSGHTIGMVDADLGWHVLLSTDGTESQRTIRINQTVDLPDEIHPIYGDDTLALVRATAGIDASTHNGDDLTVSCPLGLGAGLGAVASVPVDGAAVVGQVESVTWTGTPNVAPDQAVVRRHVAIAPEPYVPPVPPVVTDDIETTNSATVTGGNVLENDEGGLIVVAVSGLSANVAQAVSGSNGGTFVIASNGDWTFDPVGDFGGIPLGEFVATSVMYHASNGEAETGATLTVTVNRYNSVPVATDDIAETTATTMNSGNVLANDTDAENDPVSVSEVNASAANVGQSVNGDNGGVFTIAADGSWLFDPGSDFTWLAGDQTAPTSVSYTVSDGVGSDIGVLTVIVTPSAGSFTPEEISTEVWYDAGDASTITLDLGAVSQLADKSGNGRHLSQTTESMRPVPIPADQNGRDTLLFDGTDRLQLGTVADIGTGAIHIFQVWKASTSYPTYLRPPLLFDNVSTGKPIQRASSQNSNFMRLQTTPNIDTGVNLRGKTSFCIHLISVVNNIPRGLEEWFDGVRTYAGTSTNAYDLTSQKITLGVGDYASFIFKGVFCEAVVVKGELLSGMREKIEGYLAHKWGLTGSLPSGHPYKSAPPTV